MARYWWTSDGHGAFAERGGDARDQPVSDVPRDEDPRLARLKKERVALERPPAAARALSRTERRSNARIVANLANASAPKNAIVSFFEQYRCQ